VVRNTRELPRVAEAVGEEGPASETAPSPDAMSGISPR
jgi:hypothetical protein